MNGKVKVTWRTLRTIAHSVMVYARVLEAYINLSLMYTADHIFLLLPTKDLINKYGEKTTPFKLETGTKPSISILRLLICPCVVWKATTHVYKKTLNMRHQAQKSFCGIFVGILEDQKRNLVYVPGTREIIYSYDLVFDESFLVRWNIRHNHMQRRWL